MGKIVKNVKNVKNIYEDYANTYDQAHFATDSAAEYVEKQRLNRIRPYLQDVKGLRVLDVACGTGTYLEIAKANGAYVVGCDLSRNMALMSKNKYIDNILVNDFHNLPFEDESFDMVLCLNSIHYSPDPEKILCEMKRVLSHNGVILISYFNILNFKFVNCILTIFFKDHQFSYQHRYLPTTMKKIFKNMNLIPIYEAGINILPFPVDRKPRNRKFLTICNQLELLINHSLLMHCLNEVFCVLRKK